MFWSLKRSHSAPNSQSTQRVLRKRCNDGANCVAETTKYKGKPVMLKVNSAIYRRTLRNYPDYKLKYSNIIGVRRFWITEINFPLCRLAFPRVNWLRNRIKFEFTLLRNVKCKYKIEQVAVALLLKIKNLFNSEHAWTPTRKEVNH